MRWVIHDETSQPTVARLPAAMNRTPRHGRPPARVMTMLRAHMPALRRQIGPDPQPGSATWGMLIDPAAQGASTAWCAEAAAFRTAILARIPVIVVPAGEAGIAVLDGAARMKGVAVTRIGRARHGEATDGPGASAMAPADLAILTGLVEATSAGAPQRADYLVVEVEGPGLEAPEVVEALLRLADGPANGSSRGTRRVQVAVAGGPELYLRLALARLAGLRAEAQAEVGLGSLAAGTDYLEEMPIPASGTRVRTGARLSGHQRMGGVAGMIVLLALISGPIVGYALSHGGTELAPSVAAAAAPSVSAAPIAAVSVHPAAPVHAEAALVDSADAAQKQSAADRERLLRSYQAQRAALERLSSGKLAEPQF